MVIAVKQGQMHGSSRIRQFGVFLTPPELARKVCLLLAQQGIGPASLVEPTCGRGNFITAALHAFPTLKNAVGVEINPQYVSEVCSVLCPTGNGRNIRVHQADFFSFDWDNLLASLPEPLLLIGNPPWVTNSTMGSLGGSNLPEKSNHRRQRGIDAITGSSNFDISEWMLVRMLDWIAGRQATLAMLCKTSVARKVLLQAWQNGNKHARADLYRVEAQSYFRAAVDACLLVITASGTRRGCRCRVHPTLSIHAVADSGSMGYENGRMLADVAAYQSWRHLEGSGGPRWRSGIKHDCALIMELSKVSGQYRNGLGQVVTMESDYLYPMLKSSDLANSPRIHPRRYVIVPQQFVGEDTRQIARQAPKTWEYLQAHSERLERRASSVYRGKPRFSIFGVGEYSFAPWKVAVSGFYKRLNFRACGPWAGKPVMFDSTCSLLPCRTREEAECIATMLNSEVAEGFFSAFVFWDAKRPITIELLQRLDLLCLARELGMEARLLACHSGFRQQPRLLRESAP